MLQKSNTDLAHCLYNLHYQLPCLNHLEPIRCKQVARLPKATARVLPSSPSCQLQGMLCVNLCGAPAKRMSPNSAFECHPNTQNREQHGTAGELDKSKNPMYGQRVAGAICDNLCIQVQIVASQKNILASAQRESSNRTDQPLQNESTPRVATCNFAPGKYMSETLCSGFDTRTKCVSVWCIYWSSGLLHTAPLSDFWMFVLLRFSLLCLVASY